jgi:hypothetical protein
MARKKQVPQTVEQVSVPTEPVVLEEKPVVKEPTRDKAIKELMALRAVYLPLNKTPGGKELAIFKVANTSLLRINWKDGGQLPAELNGMFTKSSLAQAEIQRYLTKMWDVALGEEPK